MPKITEEQFRSLQEDVEEAQRAADRAKGARDQLMSQLKKEFSVDSVKEARKLLTELETKRDAAQAKFESAFSEYEKKWKKE